MLITHKTYHDYYDTAIGVGGVDKTCVYERKYEEIEGGHPFVNIIFPSVGTRKQYHYPAIYDEVHAFIVGFCGKTYVGYKFITCENIEKHIHESSYVSYDRKKVFKNLTESLKYGSHWAEKSLNELYDEWHEKDNLELFRKYNVPIFSISSYDKKRGVKFEINPSLKQFDWTQKFDAFSTLQEIHMFLSGVLGNKEKDITVVSDSDRVKQRGFDKWSFRKEPGKIKRKKHRPI